MPTEVYAAVAIAAVSLGLVLAAVAGKSRIWHMAALALPLLVLWTVHTQAGWPARVALPAEAIILMVTPAGDVWAVPPGAASPRAYTLDNEAMKEQLITGFYGRAGDDGKANLSPMLWHYDEAQKFTLIPLPTNILPKE